MAPPVGPLHGFLVSLGTCDQPPLTAPHQIGHPFVHAACTTILHSCSSLRPHTCLPALMCAPAAMLCTHSGRSHAAPRRATW